ncbi:MAG: guanosine polyphosphate pyrophosphohydrolase [Lachnospiraceae bacterium]|nr:guanosine polyphosphate pyrophosphohydrolase [Lachnospiraceae bacterium]
MITLNDYLYSGDTVLKILHRYIADLSDCAEKEQSLIDRVHCDILCQIRDILEHNDFLTAQSHRIKELYMYMTKQYPQLAFTFRGRIKSLIRAEEKINGYIVEYISDYYLANGRFPSEEEVRNRLLCFRDIIAYRIVISLPKCHVDEDKDVHELEIGYLYELANMIPNFLTERGFSPVQSGFSGANRSRKMEECVSPFFRDYIVNPRPQGYQSLHITLYDNISRCFTEVQLRTKEMDDNAEIGSANHFGYEKRQEEDRNRRAGVPVGVCRCYDEACERLRLLQEINLAALDVNMFKAFDNYRINDGCGLFRGRYILPFEHLSRFQSD